MTKDDYIEWITRQYIDLLQWVQEDLSKSADDTSPRKEHKLAYGGDLGDGCEIPYYSPQREQKIVYGAGSGMPLLCKRYTKSIRRTVLLCYHG